MSHDIKMIKFGQMIRDIINKLDGDDIRSLLFLIYDYNKLNNFGKTIMEIIMDEERETLEQLSIELDEEEVIDDLYKALESDDEDDEDVKKSKIDFIFWALMILAVDDTDKEKYLSLICDFARILKISDAEVMDVVKVVRLVFHKEVDGNIESTNIIKYFKKLIRNANRT